MEKIVVHKLIYLDQTIGYRFELLKDGVRAMAFDVSKNNGKSFMNMLNAQSVEKGEDIVCFLVGNSLVSNDETDVIEVKTKDSALSAIGAISDTIASNAKSFDTSWYPKGWEPFTHIPKESSKLLHPEGIQIIEALINAGKGVDMCTGDYLASELMFHYTLELGFKNFRELLHFYYNVGTDLKLKQMYIIGVSRYDIDLSLPLDNIINDVSSKGLFSTNPKNPWWDSEYWGTNPWDSEFLHSSLGDIWLPHRYYDGDEEEFYAITDSTEKYKLDTIFLKVYLPNCNDFDGYFPRMIEATFNTGLYNKYFEFYRGSEWYPEGFKYYEMVLSKAKSSGISSNMLTILDSSNFMYYINMCLRLSGNYLECAFSSYRALVHFLCDLSKLEGKNSFSFSCGSFENTFSCSKVWFKVIDTITDSEIFSVLGRDPWWNAARLGTNRGERLECSYGRILPPAYLYGSEEERKLTLDGKRVSSFYNTADLWKLKTICLRIPL